jgi:hypothetical protein
LKKSQNTAKGFIGGALIFSSSLSTSLGFSGAAGGASATATMETTFEVGAVTDVSTFESEVDSLDSVEVDIKRIK